jgi:hypothetical protein
MRSESPAVELRAVLPDGVTLPPSPATIYSCHVSTGRGRSYGPLSASGGFALIVEAADGHPPIWGSRTRITVQHGRVTHTARVRWTPQEVHRWLERSLQRVLDLRALEAAQAARRCPMPRPRLRRPEPAVA